MRATIIVMARDVVARTAYRLGTALCQFAGWWDAGTDQYERRHRNGKRTDR